MDWRGTLSQGPEVQRRGAEGNTDTAEQNRRLHNRWDLQSEKILRCYPDITVKFNYPVGLLSSLIQIGQEVINILG